MFSTEINYEVSLFSIGDTKSGTKMGKLQLKNPDDGTLLNCILWEETLNRLDAKVFRIGNIVRIVTATFNEKFNNCLISALELVKEAKTGLDEKQRDEAYRQLFEYINKIKQEELKSFVTRFFKENEAQVKIAPAAKAMHHNYIGGLLVHTLEVLKFADCAIPAFSQKVNTDNIYAACIMHDCGKIFEYSINLETGLVDYDEDFRKDWISHTQYGFSLCMGHGFKEVAKMIAAHHGRKDWGAIIDLDERDLAPTTYLIHHLDDLSAKFGKTTVALIEEGV